jgi:hypothetical protein
MGKALLIATALSLVSVAPAGADGFDLNDLYGRAKSFAEALLPTAAPQQPRAKVPAAEIDPEMALLPRGEGRMRVIAPPGSPGGNPKLDPR